MNQNLIEILVCPNCEGNLNLEIDEKKDEYIMKGKFICVRCGNDYFIYDDIPYFKPLTSHKGIRNQQITYSAWWDRFQDDSVIVDSENANYLFNSIRIPAKDFEDKLILDAGCGSGRFSYAISFYKPKLLIAFDISTGLLHARKAITKRNPSAQVAFVQGDITRPPFKKNVIEIVVSWGVIHHTPDTRKTFSVLSNLLKPKGRLGIFVYQFNPIYNYQKRWLIFVAFLRAYLIINPLRWVSSRLPVFMVKLIFQPIYFLEKMLGFSIVGCHKKGPENKPFIKRIYFAKVIDRFKTRYATEHQLQEIVTWFKEEGFDNLRIGYTPPISISGKKGSSQNHISIELYKEPDIDNSASKYLQ